MLIALGARWTAVGISKHSAVGFYRAMLAQSAVMRQ